MLYKEFIKHEIELIASELIRIVDQQEELAALQDKNVDIDWPDYCSKNAKH